MKKTTILLVAINAKYIHSNPAVYSLKAACGHPELVEIAEFTINDRYQDILGRILAYEADLIGFSTYIWNTELVTDLAADIRCVKRDTAILFAGGPEASYSPDRFLTTCDFVICGEGEIPFRMIVDYIAELYGTIASESLGTSSCADGLSSPNTRCAQQNDILQALPDKIRANIPGAIFRKGTEIAANPASPEAFTALDELPFLYKNLDLFHNRILYYESSRGCPFSCTYCLSSIDKHLRFRSLDKVYSELQYFLDRKVPQVKFIDRTFNCNHVRTMGIWSYLREHDNGKTNFHFEIGADILNEEELTLLESLRPGLVQLEIGIQSTNPETLKAIRRNMNLEKLYANIRRLRRAQNINLHVDLIAGLPYEGFDSFARSFNDVYALHADQLQLGFLKVLGGTEMMAKAEAYDLRYSVRPPYEVLSTKWITCTELDLLRRICDVLEYYYNSQQFTHTLTYLEQYWENAFGFFRALAEFFKITGYDTERPAASRRYEVLKEFVKGWEILSKNVSGFNQSVFEEYLRFDRNLHIHKNRRHSVSDVYNFGEGEVLVVIDYEKKAYTISS